MNNRQSATKSRATPRIITPIGMRWFVDPPGPSSVSVVLAVVVCSVSCNGVEAGVVGPFGDVEVSVDDGAGV